MAIKRISSRDFPLYVGIFAVALFFAVFIKFFTPVDLPLSVTMVLLNQALPAVAIAGLLGAAAVFILDWRAKRSFKRTPRVAIGAILSALGLIGSLWLHEVGRMTSYGSYAGTQATPAQPRIGLHG
jgi:hypothetical protein